MLSHKGCDIQKSGAADVPPPRQLVGSGDIRALRSDCMKSSGGETAMNVNLRSMGDQFRSSAANMPAARFQGTAAGHGFPANTATIGTMAALGGLLQMAGNPAGMSRLATIGRSILDAVAGSTSARLPATHQSAPAGCEPCGGKGPFGFNSSMRDVLGAVEQKSGPLLAAAEQNGRSNEARDAIDSLTQLLCAIVAIANILKAPQSQAEPAGAGQGGPGHCGAGGAGGASGAGGAGGGGSTAGNAGSSMLDGLMAALFGDEEGGDEEEENPLGSLVGSLRDGLARARSSLDGSRERTAGRGPSGAGSDGARRTGAPGSAGPNQGSGGTEEACSGGRAGAPPRDEASSGAPDADPTGGSAGTRRAEASSGKSPSKDVSTKGPTTTIRSAADLEQFQKNAQGEYVIDKTCVIDGNVDLQGAKVTAGSNLGDGGQSEGQKPIFAIKSGGAISNVTVGSNGADGIHTFGDAAINSVHFKDVGEDAITVKSSGNVSVSNSTFKGAADKVIQVNADCNLRVDRNSADGFQTFIRTNGGKQITAKIDLTNSELSNGRRAVYTDSKSVAANLSDNVFRGVRTAFQGAGESVLNSLRNSLGGAKESGTG